MWQLPLAGLFIAGWILGGGWLLRSGARKSKSAKLRQITLVRCCQLSFLSGVFAMGAAGATLGIFVGLSRITGSRLVAVGGLLAIALAICLAFLVFHASRPGGLRESLALAIKPICAVLLLAVALGACAYFPARSHVMERARYTRTFANLARIRDALNAYHRRYGLMPERLEQLAAADDISADKLVSAINPHLPVGYYYVRPQRANDQPAMRLVVVSFFSEKYPGGRALLFGNGLRRWSAIAEAELFLSDEINEDFTAGLRRIEADLPPPP